MTEYSLQHQWIGKEIPRDCHVTFSEILMFIFPLCDGYRFTHAYFYSLSKFNFCGTFIIILSLNFMLLFSITRLVN